MFRYGWCASVIWGRCFSGSFWGTTLGLFLFIYIFTYSFAPGPRHSGGRTYPNSRVRLCWPKEGGVKIVSLFVLPCPNRVSSTSTCPWMWEGLPCLLELSGEPQCTTCRCSKVSRVVVHLLLFFLCEKPSLELLRQNLTEGQTILQG